MEEETTRQKVERDGGGEEAPPGTAMSNKEKKRPEKNGNTPKPSDFAVFGGARGGGYQIYAPLSLQLASLLSLGVRGYAKMLRPSI